MRKKKVPKLDVFPVPINYAKEEEDLLQDIFTENFLNHFLLKIDVSQLSRQKSEKIANELSDVLEKNLQKPDKSIDLLTVIYFYSKGLVSSMVTLETFIDFKKYTDEYKKG